MIVRKSLFCVIIISVYFIISANASIKRCFSCRSRGELGSCKDKFKYYNASQLDADAGVEIVPCASGWCGKVIETSDHDLKVEEYGVATQRMCLQRSPSDNEERCDDTVRSRKKVFMCFCRGDLCNNSIAIQSSTKFILLSFTLLLSLCSLFKASHLNIT